MSSIYFCVIVMVGFWFGDTRGVMLRNNVKLFCQFFVNFLITIRTRLLLSQLSYTNISKNVKNIVNPLRPDPTNGQTQSNYSLAIADELFECVLPLYGIKFKRVKSQNHFDICVKPNCWIYLLQSLQGHSCSRQFFIPDLNKSRESEFFRWRGSIYHILCPRKLSDSEP